MQRSLIDPYSAQYFGWKGPSKGWVSDRLSGYAYGWRVCVEVNAKNRMGGYTGAHPYFFVIRDGRVVRVDTGRPGTIGAQMTNQACASIYNQSSLPAQHYAAANNTVESIEVVANDQSSTRDIERQLIVKLESINVQGQPGFNGRVLEKKDKGDKLTSIAENDGWFKVSIGDGSYGWVAKGWVSVQ